MTQCCEKCIYYDHNVDITQCNNANCKCHSPKDEGLERVNWKEEYRELFHYNSDAEAFIEAQIEAVINDIPDRLTFGTLDEDLKQQLRSKWLGK